MNRRTFLNTLALGSGLALPALPALATEQTSSAKPDGIWALGPWTLSGCERHFELRFRGNVFAHLDTSEENDKEFRQLAWHEALRKLAAVPYTPSAMNFLYSTDPWLRQMACLVVDLAREQKHGKHWAIDDIVALRGDALGHILYDLLRGTR